MVSLAPEITATPAAIRPQGWTSGPRARAKAGDMLSMPVCHFGTFFGFLGLPIRRHCRTAMSTSTTPMAILAARAASAGEVLGFGGLLPVTTRVKATTVTNERSHPRMKAAPLRTPPFDASTRMNAVSGMGSSVMANPIRMRSMTTRLRPPFFARTRPGASTSHGHAGSAQHRGTVVHRGGKVGWVQGFGLLEIGGGQSSPEPVLFDRQRVRTTCR